MIKKLFLTVLFTATLLNFGLMLQPNAYAQSSAINDTDFTFDLTVLQNPSMKSIEKQNWMKKGIDFLFERGITIMAGTIGTAAVLMMSIGGFMILSSAGNDAQVTKGRGLIMKALMGLAFVLGAYILVTTVQLLIKSIFQT